MYKTIRQSIAVALFTPLLFSFSLANAAQMININKADAVTIADNLNGIGEAKARAIIEYRKLHGNFQSAEDLAKVKGIGFKLIERNSSLISFESNDETIGRTSQPANSAMPLEKPSLNKGAESAVTSGG